MKNLLPLLSLFLLALSCTPKEIGPQAVNPSSPGEIRGRKVILINQGNFGRGGSSISVYVPSLKKHYPAVYSGANEGNTIGDVAQSMVSYNQHYLTVVNGSAYIAVMDTGTFEFLDSIKGAYNAPVYAAIFNNRAFATDLFTGSLWTIDLTSKTVTVSVPLPAPGSRIMTWNGLIAVAAGDQLVLVDGGTANVDTMIELSSTLDRMRIAPDSTLWVMCEGNSSEPGELIRIRPDLSIDFTFSLPGEGARFLSINQQNGRILVKLPGGIYTLVNDNTLNFQLKKLIDLTNENVYALDVDPWTGDIYMADALDFDQHSDIYRYDSTGILLDQFKGGIITGNFHFTPKN
jgi:hypothetical protein